MKKRKVYRCAEERILDELKPISHKYQKKVEAIEKGVKEELEKCYVTVKEFDYYTSNEIYEAYGWGFMTMRQCDEAVEELKRIKGLLTEDEQLKQLKDTVSLLNNIFWALRKDIERKFNN